MKQLVEDLIKLGALKTDRIIKAFLATDRKNFVPPELAAEAYVDAPLPIGQGQTISQPYTVAFMMELLEPRPGQKILDVGFGSGWTTAILAHIAGEKGKVFGLEIVPELFTFGKANLQKSGYRQAKLYNQSGWEGLPGQAPFDRILVSAAAREVPNALKEQLKIGGKMVIPVGSMFDSKIAALTKKSAKEFRQESFPGFAFVPLVK